MVMSMNEGGLRRESRGNDRAWRNAIQDRNGQRADCGVCGHRQVNRKNQAMREARGGMYQERGSK